jgi:hypothetical protein
LAGTRGGCPETRLFARSGHERVAAIVLFTMSNSAVFFVPTARCCARVLLVSFPSAPMRGGRSAERRTISVVARFGARRSALVEARRASGGTRSPLGAPPWRFSAGGRASFSGISSGSVQRAPRSQVVMPGGRGPGPPGADGYEPRPQDATPRSAFGSSPETAPQMSEDFRIILSIRMVVNIEFALWLCMQFGVISGRCRPGGSVTPP